MSQLKSHSSRTSASLVAGAALCALLLGVGTSFATTLSGTVTTTAVSGFQGTPFTVGDADSATHAVYGISSEERNDNPCFVAVKKENVNNSSAQTSPSKDLCGSNGPTSSELYVDYGNSDATGEHTFVTGIKVCMNSAKTRVKGYKLRGAEVSDYGTLIELRSGGSGGCSEVFQQGSQEYRLCGGGVITEPSAKRSNCDDTDGWMSWVECPAGKVATAMELHFEAGNEPRSLTGIALKCKTVAP